MDGKYQRMLRRTAFLLLDIIVCFISALITIYVVENTLRTFYEFLLLIIALIVVQILSLMFFKIYRIRIVDSSLDLMVRGLGALAVSGFLIILIVLFSSKDFSYTFRLVATYWVYSTIFLLGYRIIYRVASSYHFRRGDTDGRPKAIIYGAGEIGSQLVRMYFKNKLGFSIIGFIDDDPMKVHTMVQGIPVIGTSRDLHSMMEQHKPNVLIIAITKLSSDRMKETLDIAGAFKAEVKIVPSLFEVEQGRKSITDLRSIDYADLLGRTLISIDREPIRNMVHNKRVLVTGAGGSIGSEISKQLLSYEPEQLLLLDVDETELHDVSLRLHGYRNEFSNTIMPIVCDVKDSEKIERVFAKYKPELVFHAAAYKHVPMMEYYPEEAVKTNVFGTYNVFSTAVRHQVKRCILISTDKAVNPTNVMGATKRVAELVARMLSTEKTQIICVRFGNVLGSRGSMLPLFLEQIREGLPITVTDRKIIRYFMTIPEAVGLVFLAGALGVGGEVMVLDMGEQVNIYEFAKRLVKYFGDGRSKVIITGLRPGEKLYEEKLSDKDTTIPTDNPKVFKAKVNGMFDASRLQQLIDALNSSDTDDMLKILQDLVPEFSYQGPVQA